MTMVHIEGRHVRDLIAPLFFNDNTDLHTLIRKRFILAYLTCSFHPSLIEEYAGLDGNPDLVPDLITSGR